MVEMLEKSCKCIVKMLTTNLTTSTSHHLTISPSHHLCNLRKIVYYGICTGFDEALV